jgi:hypothetical protein
MYFWDTYSFEGVTPGIRCMTPDDMLRGTLSRGGEDRGCLPQLAPLRGDNMNTGHRLTLSFGAQVDGHGGVPMRYEAHLPMQYDQGFTGSH